MLGWVLWVQGAAPRACALQPLARPICWATGRRSGLPAVPVGPAGVCALLWQACMQQPVQRSAPCKPRTPRCRRAAGKPRAKATKAECGTAGGGGGKAEGGGAKLERPEELLPHLVAYIHANPKATKIQVGGCGLSSGCGLVCVGVCPMMRGPGADARVGGVSARLMQGLIPLHHTPLLASVAAVLNGRASD